MNLPAGAAHLATSLAARANRFAAVGPPDQWDTNLPACAAAALAPAHGLCVDASGRAPAALCLSSPAPPPAARLGLQDAHLAQRAICTGAHRGADGFPDGEKTIHLGRSRLAGLEPWAVKGRVFVVIDHVVRRHILASIQPVAAQVQVIGRSVQQCRGELGLELIGR